MMIKRMTTTVSTCARCEKALTDTDRVEASGRAYCRGCYETLRYELRRAVEATSKDVNYPMAVLGALVGGALGVLLWWGFTVVTNFALGLVAIAIGFLVAQGAMRLAGGKRTVGIQILCVVVAGVAFFVATYLVNMTFINRLLATRGELWRIPYVPPNVVLFYRVVGTGFGIMDLVFLGIVMWEAWIIPRPLRLPDTPTA
jgi:hypothetical protein